MLDDLDGVGLRFCGPSAAVPRHEAATHGGGGGREHDPKRQLRTMQGQQG